MTKKNLCPKCGSKKMKWQDPQLGIWECKNCGYRGSVAVKDGSVEKKVREAKKMEMLSWKRQLR
ncbi:YheV family putative metal-binding protein [Methanobacterium sp.]|uniref:YheV family putative metal-binding protein n=1 Tax=Methanobacterium sp. TaxID=2164 RepID=UPI003C70FEFE